MLKTIVRHSPNLVSFLAALQLALYQPQMRHVTRLVDALLVCERRKTLSDLYRQYLMDLDPKTVADCLRESPWTAEDLRAPRRRFMLAQMLEFARQLGYPAILWVSIDDSLGKKHKDTRHQEAVAFHHNHTESTRKKQVYSNGYVYVEVHIEIGPFGFTWDTRLYLRESTVRKLNRHRTRESRLAYRSKYALTHEMLLQLAESLPAGYQVYALFDAWYASADLIKFCRRQGWHVICALKSNRCLNGKRVDHHDQTLRHTRYQRIRLTAADASRPPDYYVRTIHGRIKGVSEDVCVIISRRNPGDKRPRYFACTDGSLSAGEALQHYQRRWPVEVDNLYLKEALGVGDFRVQSFEATDKWFAVVVVGMNYVQFQQARHFMQSHTRLSLAEVIRQHRREHAQTVLRFVAEQGLQGHDIEAVLQPFIALDSPAVT